VLVLMYRNAMCLDMHLRSYWGGSLLKGGKCVSNKSSIFSFTFILIYGESNCTAARLQGIMFSSISLKI
jgi:hypothetical protein